MEQEQRVLIQKYCFSMTLIFENVMVVIAVGRAGNAAKKMT
jgi:hypothetical protein